MANKIDLNLLGTANRYEIGYRTNFTFDIDKLLDKLNMTPSVFADIVGINVKTINKYRNGKVAKGADARLLYIINRDPKVIDYIYSFKYFYNGSEISKKTKQYIAIKH